MLKYFAHMAKVLRGKPQRELGDSFLLPLVLIAGAPRSGTTWLTREICNDDKVFDFLPECTLITRQVKLYGEILHYCDRERFRAYFGNKKNLLAYYQGNISRGLNLVVNINQKTGAEILVLKDPDLSLCLPDLEELFPPFKMIIILRDPRDVLSSMKNVTARKNVPWDLQKTVLDISLYYENIERHKASYPNNCLFIRYEDVVVSGLDVVRHFLGRPVNTSLTRGCKIKNVKENASIVDPFFSPFYLTPTTEERIGSYKKVLDEGEIKYVESIFAGIIHRWGY